MGSLKIWSQICKLFPPKCYFDWLPTIFRFFDSVFGLLVVTFAEEKYRCKSWPWMQSAPLPWLSQCTGEKKVTCGQGELHRCFPRQGGRQGWRTGQTPPPQPLNKKSKCWQHCESWRPIQRDVKKVLVFNQSDVKDSSNSAPVHMLRHKREAFCPDGKEKDCKIELTPDPTRIKNHTWTARLQNRSHTWAAGGASEQAVQLSCSNLHLQPASPGLCGFPAHQSM